MTNYFFLLVSVFALLSSCSSGSHSLPVNTYYIYSDSNNFESSHKNFNENKYIPAFLKFDLDTTKIKLRIRGDSSREYPKKSLKIKVLEDRKVNGKSKLNLNAEYKDQSFSHSYLSSLIFKELNYPCFSSSIAATYVNNSFHGLFMEIENMDADFLIRNQLNPKGDLFKATKDGACLYTVSELDEKWEKKSNKKGNWTALRNLIQDLQDLEQEDFDAYIKANFDYNKLIDYLALNNFIANGSTNYHNYYLYKDVPKNGKWIFIPWDLDKSLSYYNWKPFDYHSTSSNWENDNPLIERCYLSASIRNAVKQRLLSFETILGPNFYEPILASIEQQLLPFVLKDKTDKVETKKQWEKALKKESKFLKNRAKKAIKMMDKFPLSFEVHKTATLLSVPFSISWSKSADSLEVSYKVYLSKDFLYRDDKDTKIIATKGNSIEISEALPLGKYYWKVVALKNGLEVDGFNSKNSFELKTGTVLPNQLNANLTLTKENSPYRVFDSLSVSQKVVLSAQAGAVLLLNKNAKIKVFGGIDFKGSKENQIYIGPDKPNNFFHSIYFYSSPFLNKIEHTTIFEGLLNSKYSSVSLNSVQININKRPMQFGTKRPSVVWVWHGDASINYLTINGNGKGEGININWAKSSVLNSRFYNTPDAIEFINVRDGEIANNLVQGSPDDAIDLNACKDVLISHNALVNSADKGISIGAEQYGKSSNIRVCDNYILGNKIGLSVKDSANVNTENNTYAFNNLAFEAYRKNKSYDLGGTISSEKDVFFENKNHNKIDQLSTLTILASASYSNIIELEETFMFPQKLKYLASENGLVLNNTSLFDIALHNADLFIDGAFVSSLKALSKIPSKTKAYIYTHKPSDRKSTNYLTVKNYTLLDSSAVSLKIGNQFYQLKQDNQ